MIEGRPTAVEQVRRDLDGAGYLCGTEIAGTVHLARALERPMLVEGPPGSGKTELAKAVSRAYGLPLVRLQCYEGLDESKAIYEWQYGKQLLFAQFLRHRVDEVLADTTGLGGALERLRDLDAGLFSFEFLEERPLLKALRSPAGAVLLVDEVDKADPAFEALLLELLAEYQITVPEIGTITPAVRPLIVLTSNATREVSDALRRRCLYLHLGMPDEETERCIVARQVPGIGGRLCAEVVAMVRRLRAEPLQRAPSTGEMVEWARALVLLGAEDLGREVVRATLGLLAKTAADHDAVWAAMDRVLPDGRGA